MERRDAGPAWGVLLGLAGAKLALHAALAGRYGWFRDELYFLDCGRHLAWGYVDHAPLVGLLARIVLLLGSSLVVARLIAALAGAALVLLTGLLAWRLGGSRFAQGLASLSVLVAPIYLATASVLSMNVFEPLFWMGGVYALVRLVQAGNGRYWLLLGALLGLGLMNKHSTVFFFAALLVGILASPERHWLRTRWPWLGGALALALFSPNLTWQALHGFPTMEDLRNVARIGKNVVLGPVDFFGQQVGNLHPLLLPLWLGGLAALAFGSLRRYRALAVAFGFFFVVMFVLKAKSYYLAPVYPMLLAAGSVAFEGRLDSWRWSAGRLGPRGAAAVAFAAVALLVLGGALLAPLALPLLPPEGYVAYSKALGVGMARTEVAHRGPLPQLFGDQFGWPEFVVDVARAWNGLTPAERERGAIFANNYGEAGAINLFGPALGLPRAISAHQSHFLWGPPAFRGDVLVVTQESRASLERLCASVEEAGRHEHRWGMAEENGPIWVCRGLKTPLPDLWPRLKHWN